MDFFRELKTALRLLFRNGSSTVIAMIILTLGLTVCIYMFGAIDAFVLRPLPFPHPEQLTHFEWSTPDDDSVEVPKHDYLDWRASQKSIESLEAFYT